MSNITNFCECSSEGEVMELKVVVVAEKGGGGRAQHTVEKIKNIWYVWSQEPYQGKGEEKFYDTLEGAMEDYETRW
jgi:hypothetical protein